MQARCAGFVQAEIERYADAIAEADAGDADVDDDASAEAVEEAARAGGETDSEQSDNQRAKTNKQLKTKVKPVKSSKLKKKIVSSQKGERLSIKQVSRKGLTIACCILQY